MPPEEYDHMVHPASTKARITANHETVLTASRGHRPFEEDFSTELVKSVSDVGP